MPRKISPIPDNPKKKGSGTTTIGVHGEIKQGELIFDNTGNKWKLGKAIGIGGFGEIYDVVGYGSFKKAKKSSYVAKIEKHTNGPLFVEINCYLRLGKLELIEQWKQEKRLSFLGLPHFVASGSHLSNAVKYRFLVMPKYDKDLEAIFQTKRMFNLKTVLVIALRIIDTLEYIHSHGYVHSDIKASNIMLGHSSSSNDNKRISKSNTKRKSSRTRSPIKRFTVVAPKRDKPIARTCVRNLRPAANLNYAEDQLYSKNVSDGHESRKKSRQSKKEEVQSKQDEATDLNLEADIFDGDEVYLLDYGLASKFLLSNGEHREFSSDQRRAHAGTILFCSRDAHKGIPTRRSDLESLAYNMIYWLTGTLPWVEDVHEPELVEKKKNRCFTDINTFLQICFEDCPNFMVELFAHLSKLQFQDMPNYDFFRNLFKKTIKEYGYKDDSKLDFDNLEGTGKKQKQFGKVKEICKRPSLLLYSPLKPLSSNIIFKRPKLRKKIKDKLAKNSMMNWSKILIMDPETIMKTAAHRKSPDDDKNFNILEFDLESLNPTPAMREVFNKASEREERSPYYGSRGDEICSIDSIDGYTSEMMRVHRRTIEQRELELELAVQQNMVTKKRGRKRTKRPESPIRIPSKSFKNEVSASQHALKKVKCIPLKRTYSLRG